MTIITAGGLADPAGYSVFNKNGSVITLKKISETDWLLFGDIAEGTSEGFPLQSSEFPGVVYSQDPNQGGINDFFQLSEGPEYGVTMTGPGEYTVEIHPGDASFKWFGIDFGNISKGITVRGVENVNGPPLMAIRDNQFTYNPEHIGVEGSAVEIDSIAPTDIGSLADGYSKLLIRPVSDSSIVLYVTLHITLYELG